MNKSPFLLVLCILLLCVQCKEDEEETPTSAEIRFGNDRSAFENEQNSTFDFEVKLSVATSTTVRVDYTTEDISTQGADDFNFTSGTLTFAPGQTSQTISVEIVVDEYLEGDEQFKVVLSDPVNGFLKNNVQEAIGTIKDDDSQFLVIDEGYVSADSYPGMTLSWADEFNGSSIDLTNWTYDIGTGNNGWGNSELQNYTASSDNSFIQDGNLMIVAKEQAGSYTSARLKSVGLQEYQYGRVDVRALLPVDQGLWPAIWMLGANFESIGWPACGEIDIAEVIGSAPNVVHGTIHYGNNFSQWQSDGTFSVLEFPETVASQYHVFSVVWEENSIIWYLDDVEYHSIDNTTVGGQNYPFNNPFFFILNVAVGGQWPGSPDESTTFPKFMAVDYVRIFQ